MDADEQFNVMPMGPLQRLAEVPSDGRQWGTSDPAAACMEVSVRALGRQALSGTSKERPATESFEETTKTLLLFPRGAVILLAKPVACGQDLILINERTNRYAHCRVTNVRQTPDLSYVEVEFTHSIPDFWGITFSKAAAAHASAVPTPVIQSSPEPPERESVEVPIQARAKALAAAASAGIAVSVPAPTPRTVNTPVTSVLSARAEMDEDETASRFFAPQAMEFVPLCEPVADEVPALSISHSEGSPTREPVKWESLSPSKPQKRRKHLGTAAVVGACAILLGYHLYSSAEAALPETPGVEGRSGGDAPNAADGAPMAPGGPETTGSGEAASVVVVSAPEPEIDVVDTHTKRVVLVSGMTMPVQASATQHQDAPELSVSAGQAPNVSDAEKTVGLLGTMGPPPPPPPEQAPDAAAPAAETLTPAQLVSSVQPVYPQAAREARTQGDVVIETMVDTTGRVTQMSVLSGSPLLREAAISAVAKWKFQPALLGTRPVSSSTVVTIHFRLQ